MSRNGYRGTSPFADAFIANYVRLRARRAMSLQELSDATGIAKSYLSDIQHGRLTGISLEYAVRIANALGEPIAAMISTQASAGLLAEQSA